MPSNKFKEGNFKLIKGKSYHPCPQCQPNQTYCTAVEGLLICCAGLDHKQKLDHKNKIVLSPNIKCCTGYFQSQLVCLKIYHVSTL